ncbi:MAG: hypothetical protein CM1200mP2_59700 [Planctomycetaceae bacterium]|nr:MAG: hypothetical protein CM1200mP2_59700 [Planctomycetaceae bacterium]
MYMRNRPSASCTIEGANNRSDMWATSGQGHNRIPGSGENSSPSSETALRMYPWHSGYGLPGPTAV